MIKKYRNLLLILFFSIISVGLFLYRLTASPPCLNADEATNAYDAYSILSTGKDQYGNFLPLRFKSFGDYKLPLLTYMAVPFIKIFGLNEVGIRLVNLPFVFFFPLIIYLLTKQLFNNEKVGLLSAFLISVMPGIQLLGRQAHEGYMTTFFLTVLMYLFLKLIKKESITNYLLFFSVLLISLFGYHFSRLWAGFYFLLFIFLVIKKQLKVKSIFIFLAIILIFGITDIIYSPSRIKNLLFFNNPGFVAKIQEFQSEGGHRLIYNQFTIAIKDISQEYLKYFSPQFLSITGDETDNFRFGFPGVSPMTPIEYLFIFIGLFYLYKNKEKWRHLLLLSLLFAPISACLSWAGVSITRSTFIFIPLVIIIAYGVINSLKTPVLIKLLVVGGYIYFLFFSWDIYLHHYPKRGLLIRSWQCGYKELASYVKENYQQNNQFYITRKNGQPYIFLLFYLNYSPAKYQQVAKLSPPDEYGFGQVESFDKFIFDLPGNQQLKDVSLIGFPDDFNQYELDGLQKIQVGNEAIFYIKQL